MTTCPERRDDVVFEAAFVAFWPKLWKYLKTQPDITDNTEQEWKKSAHKVLNRNYVEDGYELAKDFEGEHWDVDADFVELADGWGHELYTAHQKAKEAWVISEGIVPKLAVGTKVRVNTVVGRPTDRIDIRDGEIVVVNAKRGEYHVFVESLGHIRPNSGKSGTTGLLVTFANLEKLNPDATAPRPLPVVADEDDQIGRTCDDA